MGSGIPVFPEKKITFFLERLGKEVTLYELSVKFRADVYNDESLGTPKNALIDAGMAAEDIDKLGADTVDKLYREVVELTYPGAKEFLDNDQDAPTDEEIADSKKNS